MEQSGKGIFLSLLLYGRKSTHTDLEHYEGEEIMTEPLKATFTLLAREGADFNMFKNKLNIY